MRAFLKRLWSFRLALAIYAILLAAGWGAGELLLGMTVPELRPMNEPMIHRMVMGALVLFVVMAAIPFVPGAEIGFALLLMFGGQASGIVYAGMVGALLLSFTVARFVPLSLLSQLTASLRLAGAARFFDLLASMPAEERSRFISDRLDGQFSSTLLKNRYLALAILLNVPGNSLLGGAGGLAFMAGVSGLYRFWPYLLSVLIAVAPIPLIFYFF